MSSTAAEFSLRRRLLNRTAFFVLGALAFVAVASRYPPLELDGVLIFVGVLFFVTLGLAIWVERRALRHGDVEKLKRVYYGLIPLPWILSALLLANGAMDHGPWEVEQARVVGKFSMSGALPSRRLVVTSWRPGHRVERLSVDRRDLDLFNRGDVVNVTLGTGLVGIPWVVGVSLHLTVARRRLPLVYFWKCLLRSDATFRRGDASLNVKRCMMPKSVG